eukprot:TRINITY_DN27924_c0_g1_i2.p1 TRINITY_DN27924_c0_g1~~TRINITY_DN27924_c0_g1_i2.p1  ORF type:complete len:833 (-),score=194.06 TRINITY_DN27924_c0_g1_i2:17-2515(-)
MASADEPRALAGLAVIPCGISGCGSACASASTTPRRLEAELRRPTGAQAASVVAAVAAATVGRPPVMVARDVMAGCGGSGGADGRARLAAELPQASLHAFGQPSADQAVPTAGVGSSAVQISDCVRRVSTDSSSSLDTTTRVSVDLDLAPRVIREERTIIRAIPSTTLHSARERSLPQRVQTTSVVGSGLVGASSSTGAMPEEHVEQLVRSCIERKFSELRGADARSQAHAPKVAEADVEKLLAARARLDSEATTIRSGPFAEEARSREDCEVALASLRNHLSGGCGGFGGAGFGAPDAAATPLFTLTSESAASAESIRGVEAAQALRNDLGKLRAATGERLDSLASALGAATADTSALAKEFRAALEAEALRRAAGHDDVLSRLRALDAERDVSTRGQATLREEVQQLRCDTLATTRQLKDLWQRVERESAELRAGLDVALARFGELREDVDAEMRGRELLGQALRDGLERERGERGRALGALRSDLAAPLAPIEREVASLSARILDMEQSHAPRSEDRLLPKAALFSALEGKCAELSQGMEVERRARASLAQEVEEVVKSQRTKLRNLVSQMSDAVKKSYDSLRASTSELLDVERAARTEQQSALEAKLSAQQAALDSIKRSVGELEPSVQKGWLKQGDSELASRDSGRCSKSSLLPDNMEELQLYVRRSLQQELHEGTGFLESRLASERSAREELHASLSERLSGLEALFEGLRELSATEALGRQALRERRSQRGALLTAAAASAAAAAANAASGCSTGACGGARSDRTRRARALLPSVLEGGSGGIGVGNDVGTSGGEVQIDLALASAAPQEAPRSECHGTDEWLRTP